MVQIPWPPEFDWDEGNRDKNRLKQGISCEECEQVFVDPFLRILPDPGHSAIEERYLAFGKNFSGRELLVGFTMRSVKIRPISVRRANERESEKYGRTNS